MNIDTWKQVLTFALCYTFNFCDKVDANFSESSYEIKISKIDQAESQIFVDGKDEASAMSESISQQSEIIGKANGVRNNSIKMKKPVKLTMKQGLIMNQVISTYALSGVKSPLCKNHTEKFKSGLRAFQPWALKMFDSSSKIPSGILDGNLAEYGAYSQCLNIYEETEYGPIRGRHCSLRITPSDGLMKTILGFRNISDKRFQLLKSSVLEGVKLMWSVCVPESCHAEDVFGHFNKNIIELIEGLDVSISLEEKYCFALIDQPQVTIGDYVVISFIGLTVLVVTVASIIDYTNGGESNWYLSIFSAYSNGARLFSMKSGPNDLKCLHGLRYLSICWIVIGHRYIQQMAFPASNSMDLIDWVQRYFSTLLIGGTVGVDTFFVIGATLVSYNFFIIVEKTRRFSLFQFYLYRFLRITVPLAVTVAVYTTLLKHFGSGPTWYDHNYAFQKPCQYFWWSALLHIQNYVNPGAVCIIQAWYLTDDMFFFYLSPVIFLPLWKCPKFGYINWIVIYITSITVSFWVAWDNEFNGGMPISPFVIEKKYFQKHYMVPHTRSAPYLIGLALGYALFKTRGKRIHISSIMNAFGWIFSMFCLSSVVLITHIFHVDSYQYNRLFSSLFLSCSRSVWTMGLVWIIFSCENGHGGVVNFILSHPIFKILGRLVYSLLLIHYAFQSSMQASRKTPDYFSDFLTYYMACSDIFLMTILSIPYSLCFEYPVIRLATMLFRGTGARKEVKPLEK